MDGDPGDPLGLAAALGLGQGQEGDEVCGALVAVEGQAVQVPLPGHILSLFGLWQCRTALDCVTHNFNPSSARAVWEPGGVAKQRSMRLFWVAQGFMSHRRNVELKPY